MGKTTQIILKKPVQHMFFNVLEVILAPKWSSLCTFYSATLSSHFVHTLQVWKALL
jgi:hypothetical protein